MAQKKSNRPKKPKSEIKLAEERFQRSIDRRNEFNNEARVVRDERNSLHNQRNKVMEKIMGYRDDMKLNTNSKNKHQNTRNNLQENAKKLIELKQQKRKGKKVGKSLRDTVQALHSEIFNLERRRETTEIPLSKENEIIEKLTILRRSLKDE